jgi:hypothetical protein
MNKNTIELDVISKKYPDNPTLYIEIILKIDGNDFHPELVINPIALARSCQSSGELYIFTCGCGEPICAGIDEGLHIEHTLDAVIWRFYEPISGTDHEDLTDEEWEAIKRPVEYMFDPEQYLESIISGLYAMKELAVSSPQPIEFAIYGLDVAGILALEPWVFSTRLNNSEKRLIAKQIEIDAYHHSISAGGMEYRWDEIFLPLALFDAYKKWMTLRIFPTQENELPAYQAYLQEGRKFCQALRQYLGGKSKVKFKYHPPQIYNAFAWEIIEEIR